MQKSFAKTVDYRTHCSKNKSRCYESKSASRIAKLVKKLRSQLKETDFNDIGLLFSLAFLKKVGDAFDSIGICVRKAT